MRLPSTARFVALAMLISSACGDETTTTKPVIDASVGVSVDASVDSGRQSGPETTACPAQDPSAGSACSGKLRCQLLRHGDCQAPSCPSGCKYLGIIPGAKVTSGVVYFATCQDGHWAQSTEGDCSANKSAAMCECPDHDAGQ